jgi:hypothetical protein
VADDGLRILKEQQRSWAVRAGRGLSSDGYCSCVDDNLFRPLSASARNEFKAGKGTELGTDTRRGKLLASHSSSALACNVFDYWRGRDLEPVSRAFKVQSDFTELVGLEQQFSTGVGPAPANLDVVFRCADGSLFAIESKFSEPYVPSALKTVIKQKYFSADRQRWAAVGLPGCQSVADTLRTGRHSFKVLDVAQLLKHMLALGRNGSDWVLCCLWYEVRGAVADQHRDELRQLAAELGPDADHFQALTYQELLGRLASDEHREYLTYLRDRYSL